ncbi:hypothetical protein B7463_g331, partial [Scytalidium lignicola]
MDGMDAMDGSSMDGALNATGVDFSNSTQAADFLGEILDDTVFQIEGNKYARNFWYGVCTVIAVCGLFNLIQKATTKIRLRAAASNRLRPASPSNFVTSSIACITAIFREATYIQYVPEKRWSWFKLPPAGTIMLVVSYFAWVILLEFVNNDVEGAQHYTSLAVRAAWLAIAQVPLLVLLAGKNNLIGLVSGISYERLNVIHRWSARVLLFLVTLHVIFLHLSWNAYYLGPLEYATDSCIPTGWATYAILLWINLSTLSPFRNFSYEFFVIQHIITFFGFIIAIMMHLPSTAYYTRTYIYIPIALYCIDRLVRSIRFAWNNARPARATLTALDGGVTRVVVKSEAIQKWNPGSHVFLSIPKFGPGQSHPASIASIPGSHDNDLVFLLKSRQGFTSRILKSATTSSTSLLSQKEDALIDGPYGNSHADFASFDTVLLIAGSTGVTFTLPILLDLALRVQKAKLPVKRIVFLWVVKNTSWTSWISKELESASKALLAVGIELSIRIHVTCDDKFTSTDETGDEKQRGCACDKSLGPCCCINVNDGDDDNNESVNSEKAVDRKDLNITIQRKESASSISSGKRSSVLPCAVFYSGRPDFDPLLWDLLEQAEGETGVGVCGPLGLSGAVRGTVVRCSDERAVHKGTGAEGIYLHSECFDW